MQKQSSKLYSKIFPNLPNLIHGVFNRHGGISPAPYDELNVSFTVGDDPENVADNRQIIKKNLEIDTLLSATQIHGSTIYVADKKEDKDIEIPGCDALITNVPGIGLMIQQADCQAVMLYDPHRHAVANIHCGWRGSVTNIIESTITEMTNNFDTNPGDLLAAISPSLGACCAEFINYRSELPPHFHSFQVRPHYFDFCAISKHQLSETGVKTKNITAASTCTVCDSDWFSYRREGKTGRFCSVIGLKKQCKM